MSFNTDDDWMNYGLEELTRVDSPPPDTMQYGDPSLDNIPMDDGIGYSPQREMHDMQYSTDLSIPMDFGYPTEDPISNTETTMNNGYQMQPMTSNMNMYDNRQQPEYNAFEQPTMMVTDPYEVENQYIPECSPSTSQGTMMMGGQQDSVLHQPPQQQQQQQQQQVQQAPPAPNPAPPKRSKSTKKKSQAGQVKNVNRPTPVAPPPGPSTTEISLTVEESNRSVHLLSEITRLRTAQANGANNAEILRELEAEFTRIFQLQMAAQPSSVNKEILKEVTSKSQVPQQQPGRSMMLSNGPPQLQAQQKRPIAPKYTTQQQQPQQQQQHHQEYQTIYTQQQPVASTSNAQYVHASNGQVYQVIPQAQQNNHQPQTMQLQSQQVIYQQQPQVLQPAQVIGSHGQQTVQQSQLQQLTPGTIYLQPAASVHDSGPPRLQPVQKQVYVASNVNGGGQQTLGEVVRQQHQLRQQQVITQPMQHQQQQQHQMIITTSTSASTSRATNYKTTQVVQRRAALATAPQQHQLVMQNGGTPSPRGITLHHMPQQQPPQQQQHQMHQLQHHQQPILMRQLDQPPVLSAQKYDMNQMIVQQQHQQQPPPYEKIVIPKKSKEELEAQLAQKVEERRQNLESFFQSQADQLVNADTETPFNGTEDMLKRLLPFHIHYEPDFTQETLDDFDDNWLRETINIDARMKRMNEKMCSVMLRSTLNDDSHEVNLLLQLDAEYERKILEEEKAVDKDLFKPSDEVLRGANRMVVTPKEYKPFTSLHSQFEYREFDEASYPIRSPYCTPPPSPVRRPKPVTPSPTPSPPPTLQPAVPVKAAPSKKQRRASNSKQSTALKTPAVNALTTPSLANVKERLPHQPTEKDSARVPPREVMSKAKRFLDKVVNDVSSIIPTSPLIRPSPAVVPRASSAAVDDESDGSASPELGFDNVYSPEPSVKPTVQSVSIPTSTEKPAPVKRKPLIAPPLPPRKQPAVPVSTPPTLTKETSTKPTLSLPPKSTPVLTTKLLSPPITPQTLPPIRLKELLSKRRELDEPVVTEEPKLAPLKLKIKLGGAIIVDTDVIQQERKPKKEKKHKKHRKAEKEEIPKLSITVKTEQPIKSEIVDMKPIPIDVKPMVIPKVEAKTPQIKKVKKQASTPLTITRKLVSPGLRPASVNGRLNHRTVEVFESAKKDGGLRMRLSLGNIAKKPSDDIFKTPTMLPKLPKHVLKVPPASEGRLTCRISYGKKREQSRLEVFEVLPAGPATSTTSTAPVHKSCPVPKKPRLADDSASTVVLNGCENTPTTRPKVVPTVSTVAPATSTTPEEERKRKTRKVPVPTTLPIAKVVLKTPVKEVLTNGKSEGQDSRPSSSMSFLLGDDRSSGSYGFLKSPDEKESLPAIQFSDDESDDEQQHAELKLATDRAFAMQKPTTTKSTLFPVSSQIP